MPITKTTNPMIPIRPPTSQLQQSSQSQTPRHKSRQNPPKMPLPPTPNQTLQLRMLSIRQPQLTTLQLLPHRNRPIVDRKNKHHLVPRCLYKHGKSRSIPFPLRRNGFVRMVVSENDGGEEGDGDVAAGRLEVLVAAADHFFELVGDGARGRCG